ncbi:acyltransferase [Marininema halotolerans]|uniref:Transferase hexapeptide (Six repeat-containing protein) n=1 Tax=Marininema halotolerans TaxID=1155944 RepID=A0A1I6P1A5_9BACL|nr:acyltransferase [Marininema halotolerans]SFS33870.1 transferase hexapeptide (six repeat-containing protein) [Marininema halotolerans]
MNQWIHPSVKIGNGTTVGYFSVVEEDVVLGDNVTVGNHVTVHAGTHIGDGTMIADNAVIGRWPRPAKTSTVKVDADLPGLKIGGGGTIGANAVLYRGSTIGDNVLIGDQALVREKCLIGDDVVIGCQVAVENQVEIGSRTKIQTNAYITAYSRLEEEVFIAPGVTTTNDNFMGRTEKRFQLIRGPIIKQGARVGGGAILLPGVVVSTESFIAAGAVVHRDTEPATVYIGVPARSHRPVPREEIRNG